jgi:hypothetical protein
MRLGVKFAAAAGLALMPVASFAQAPLPPAVQTAPSTPADIAYCKALTAIYVRYIGHDFQYGNYSRYRANNDAQVAVTLCLRGDTAPAIPILERELINNKFTLPQRG